VLLASGQQQGEGEKGAAEHGAERITKDTKGHEIRTFRVFS
jgi:hypothetical protein